MSPGFAPPTAALPTRVASLPERDLPRENCHENAADRVTSAPSFMLLAHHRSSRRPGWLQWGTLVVTGTGGSLAVNTRPVPAPSARSLPPGPLARQIRRAAAILLGGS